jgi:hypothetical protein
MGRGPVHTYQSTPVVLECMPRSAHAPARAPAQRRRSPPASATDLHRSSTGHQPTCTASEPLILYTARQRRPSPFPPLALPIARSAQPPSCVLFYHSQPNPAAAPSTTAAAAHESSPSTLCTVAGVFIFTSSQQATRARGVRFTTAVEGLIGGSHFRPWNCPAVASTSSSLAPRCSLAQTSTPSTTGRSCRCWFSLGRTRHHGQQLVSSR